MDWRALNFDWNRARGFLVAAEEGSLSAAARALGLAQPTLGRQVSALEEELGVVLFERVGRRLKLTPGGLELLEHVKLMGDGARRISLAAAGQSQLLEGTVRVSTSQAVAMFELPRVLAMLRQLEPGIRVEVIASDTASDLTQREADIALRHFQPTEPNLIAKKIGDSVMQFYATPECLERLGNPTCVDDFSNADFIGYDESDGLTKSLAEHGLPLADRNFPIMSANWLVQWEFVKRGLGVGLMPAHVGDSAPELVRVLPEFVPYSVPRWLVTHRELKSSRRIRFVFDLLAKELTFKRT